MQSKTDILDELAWRGLIHQCTDLDGLRVHLEAGPVRLYCGFDPTAKSLHVGSLIPLITLRRFLEAGHRPIGLIGGATGLIGDPSGKSAERVLQTTDIVEQNARRIEIQVGFFTDNDVKNNLEWTRSQSVLEFLRDVGKHFSVNAMMSRDSVSSRLTREGEGISFTEFSYMLMQAQDFAKLHEREGCTLQIGGSDQWGNMCSGVDLIRRTQGKSAFALTLPLLTMADGQKFGKTAKGAIWLDPTMTSAWEFFQFWMNTEDADVIRFLKLFTFCTREEIQELEEKVQSNPAGREAQKVLAMTMTSMIHDSFVAREMAKAAGILFGKAGERAALQRETLEMLAQSLGCVELAGDDSKLRLPDLLVKAGLVPSKTQATQLIKQGGVSVNNVVKTDTSFTVHEEEWLPGGFLLLKKGKKDFALLRRV